ncbi:hypothetical protein FRC09_007997 [Ceratobasidium sp. 395]|nr:hypothetical protein FRC09_007997 [Ceratobasidium sp. 395]
MASAGQGESSLVRNVAGELMSGWALAEVGPLLDFAAGTIGGMVGLAVGFPFDTIKVRLQHPETMSRYRNSITALVTIVREERVAGLFKGISSPMAGCAFLNGLVFASTGYLIQAQQTDPTTRPTLTQITLAGAGTGIIGSLIATPTELIKIRQQANTSAGAQPSAWTVAKELWRGHGIRGLYRGVSSTAMRDMSYGTYFATYEGMRRLLTPARSERAVSSGAAISQDGKSMLDGDALVRDKDIPLSWPRLMIAGGVAGIAGWIFTFHLDSIKTRVQSVDYAPPRHLQHATVPSASFAAGNNAMGLALARAYSGTATSPYRTTWSTMMYMYRVEGLRSFWRGLWPTIVRAVPVNMATFGAYELVVGLAR